MASKNGDLKDWRVVRVEDVTTSFSGGTPPRGKSHLFGGSIPWLKSGEINSRVIRTTEETLTEEGLAESAAKWAKAGTVVGAMYGATAGTFGWLDINTTVNQAVLVIDGNKGEAENRFLLHALTESAAQLLQTVQGSGQPNLNSDLIRKLKLLLPPLSSQKKIASILDSIDEAIEATRAVIDQTRRLKTALLQDLLTNGLPHSKGKSATARFVHRYPKNWTLTSLGHVLAEPIKNGYSPISPQNPTGHWVTTLSAVSESGYRSDGVKPAPLNNSKVQESVLVPGDIIVSRSNTSELVGLAGIYNGQPSPCSYSDLLMRVRVDKSQILNAFALLWLLSGVSRDYFKRTSRGTSGSMKKIDRQILEDLPLPLPPIDEQKEIVAVGSSLDERIQAEETRLEQLCKAKSALSQGLLTGRIPVKGAE